MLEKFGPGLLIAVGMCCVVAGWLMQHELSYWEWRGGFVLLAGVVLIGNGAFRFMQARRRAS